jgi:hypothetical protein
VKIEAFLIDNKNQSSFTLLSFFPGNVDADRQRSRAASHDFIDHTNRKSQECCISAYDFLTRNASLRGSDVFFPSRRKRNIQTVREERRVYARYWLIDRNRRVYR